MNALLDDVVRCTVAHCLCEVDLQGADPLPFISPTGFAVCSHHPDEVALAAGVVPFRCQIPAQRTGGTS